MKLNEVFSGNYLKAEDLAGRTVRVTIAKAEVKEFDDGKKVILFFQGKDKQLVCNKTNCSIVAENTGLSDTDEWAGHTIQLTVKKVEFQGKLVPAIRVVLEDKTAVAAPVAPAKASPAPVQTESAEPGSDDVPFN